MIDTFEDWFPQTATRKPVEPRTVEDYKRGIAEAMETYMKTNGVNANIADPEAQLPQLAARIAQRCEYPNADKECFTTARMIMRANNDIPALLAAYARLEKPDDVDKKMGRDSFFVRTARMNPAAWQVKYVVAEAKRGAPKKQNKLFAGYEHLVHGSREHLDWLAENENERQFCDCWDAVTEKGQ